MPENYPGGYQPSGEGAPRTETQYDLSGNIIPPTAVLPAGPEAFSAPNGSYPQTPYYSGQPSGGNYVPAATSSDAVGLLTGILLAAAIGIIGSIIAMKILFYAHFSLSLVYVFIGYGVGFGLHKGVGRGGPVIGLLAVGIMVFSLFIGHICYTQDILNMMQSEGRATPPVFAALPAVVGSFGFMHWVCILLGIFACWRGIEQQG